LTSDFFKKIDVKNALQVLKAGLSTNQGQPFNEVIKPIAEAKDFSVVELYFDGWNQQRVQALLAAPQKPGTFPAFVFAYPFSGDSGTFLSDAIQFARNGFVCLMIKAPSKRPEPFTVSQNYKKPKTVRANYLQWVGDIIRGYEYLGQMVNVQEERMAYIGRNLGAAISGMVTILEPRIQATVFQAGLPSLSQFWKTADHWAAAKREKEIGKDGVKKLATCIEDFDFLPALPNTNCPNWLFQFGLQDEWIHEKDIAAIKEKAPAKSQFIIHEDNHRMQADKTASYLREWLLEQFYQEETQ